MMYLLAQILFKLVAITILIKLTPPFLYVIGSLLDADNFEEGVLALLLTLWIGYLLLASIIILWKGVAL